VTPGGEVSAGYCTLDTAPQWQDKADSLPSPRRWISRLFDLDRMSDSRHDPVPAKIGGRCRLYHPGTRDGRGGVLGPPRSLMAEQTSVSPSGEKSYLWAADHIHVMGRNNFDGRVTLMSA
jgi:hypothetical protein